jgi:hypothetical protein
MRGGSSPGATSTGWPCRHGRCRCASRRWSSRRA